MTGIELFEEGGRPGVRGIAIPYGVTIQHVETIRFTSGSAKPRPRTTLTLQHDDGKLLATTPRTMRFQETPEGLHVRATLPKTAAGEEAAELVRTDVVGGFSAELIPRQFTDASGVRTVSEADMFGLTLAGAPAFPGANVRLFWDRPGQQPPPKADPDEVLAAAKALGLQPSGDHAEALGEILTFAEATTVRGDMMRQFLASAGWPVERLRELVPETPADPASTTTGGDVRPVLGGGLRLDI